MFYKNLIIIIFFSLLSLQSCNGQEERKTVVELKENSHLNQNKMNTKKQEINVEEVKKISLSEAIKIYGNPITQEKFILGETMSEFRIELNNFYSEKQVKSLSIQLIEVTWKVNEDKNITAWYETSKKQRPVDAFVWDKDAEF
jgi:hypothetical protein